MIIDVLITDHSGKRVDHSANVLDIFRWCHLMRKWRPSHNFLPLFCIFLRLSNIRIDLFINFEIIFQNTSD